MAKGIVVAAVLVCSLPSSQVFAQSDPDVFISTGSVAEILLGSSGTPFATVFAGAGGFKPEEIAFGGDGTLYICDSSNSEIHRLTPGPAGGLITLYDRDSAIAPNDPEQPKACTVAGSDLLFLSRNGRGNNAKTGLWAIQDVFGPTPVGPVLLRSLDAVGGVAGEGLAVNYDGRVFFTFGREVWVVEPIGGRITSQSVFRRWGSTSGDGFGIAARSVLDPGTSALRTQVFVAVKFAGSVEILREIAAMGSSAGCSAIGFPGRFPNSLEFDGANDLWVALSERSNGRRGSVAEVDDPTCLSPTPAPTLIAGNLDAAVGLALTPSGTDPVTFDTTGFVNGKSGTANMCNSLFNLDQVPLGCQEVWNISCRLLPQSEFVARTPFQMDPQQDFSMTSCADFPGASGNCAEIRITQQVADPQMCTENEIIGILANWQFFSLVPLAHPGLLYSPNDFPIDPVSGDPLPEQNPFVENILRTYDPTPVPSDPVDPRATGSRDGWGSGILVVDNAPNRPPTARLTVAPQFPQCNQPVTLDGTTSFDNDWNVDHPDSVTRYVFGLDGAPIPGADGPAGSFVLDTSTLSPGTHTASLQVFDEGWDAQGALASDTVFVDFEASPDTGPPVFTSPVRLLDLGDPRVTIAANGQSASMWPPNHDLVPYELLVQVQDDCNFSCTINVASSEPANGTGDGDAFPDFVVTGPTTLELRSERAESGNGRTYTITVECTDELGNTSVSNPIVVFVASNQGGTD